MVIQKKFDLFEKLFDRNDILEAHVIVRSLFNQNPGNQEVFVKYFDFLLKIGSWDIDLQTRKRYVGEAETSLVLFLDNTDITSDILTYMKVCRNRLNEVSKTISAIEQNAYEESRKKLEAANNEIISGLADWKNKIFSANSQNELDKYLIEVKRKEEELDKSVLTEEQVRLYEDMTRQYQELISEKMLELNVLTNKEYNRAAVKDLKYVFDGFCKNEEKYKNNHSELFILTAKHMFSYDASRLFNESLIYYNHVYSYIFSKLDDDGKFALTRMSIDTQKHRK